LPELPEVETVRRGLQSLYAGRKLLSVEVFGKRTVRRHPPQLLDRLTGSRLEQASRHGKYLLLYWSGGETLVVHLRMSGQLLATPQGSPLVAHTHAVLRFAGARELRFVDPRTFGELFLATGSEPARRGELRPLPVELAHLGPDALQVSAAQLAVATQGRRAPLKSVLVDQRAVAGVGNIYADEICFSARLRPDRPASSLRPSEVRRLAGSLRSVLEAAVSARGSTLRDARYVDLEGAAGGYQSEHKVYGRAGQPCPRCRQPISKMSFGAKRAYFCANCQR